AASNNGAKPENGTSVPPAVQVAKPETPKVEPPKEIARTDPAVDAARGAEEKKNSEAMAAAAKLKADTEATAKENERQARAEIARLEKERQMAAQKQLEEQQRMQAEDAAAKKKAADDAKAKMELASAAVTPKSADPKSSDATPAAVPRPEMTN